MAPEDIAETAVAIFEADEEAVGLLVDAEAAKLEAAQETWPEVTDCDRLDEVFHDLEEIGLVARHNFACCNTCGHYEMGDEVYKARVAGKRIDGYVFYHWQDTDRAVDGEELHLRYATLDDDAEDGREIGERVRAVLLAHGLSTDWNGDASKTIQVPLAWKRRHPPQRRSPERSVELACAAWSTRLRDVTRHEMSREVALDTLAKCGKRDAAETFARAILPGAHRAHALAAVARAMAEAGENERADALWREAIDATPYGIFGDLAVFIEAADVSRSAVRDALRVRAQQEREDAAGAAVTAWLLVRDTDIPDENKGMLVERVEGIIGRVRANDESHRAAAHAALWILAARRGAEVATHRDAVLALAEDTSVQYSYAQQLITIAKYETGEEQRPAPLPPLTVAEAEATVVKGDEDFAEGLLTSGELDAVKARLTRALFDAGDVERVRRGIESTLVATKDAFAKGEREVRTWVEGVSRGATPVRPIDESWFTDDGRKKLEQQRAKWKTESASRYRISRSARQILAAATAHGQRGDIATARALLTEVAPDLTRLHRRVESGVIDVLVACGELDDALTVADDNAVMLSTDSLESLIVGLARAGRIDEALVIFDRSLGNASSRGQVVALAPALLALAVNPPQVAGTMLQAWTDADAAMAELIALVR
jgi:tetratricopeptide (TPR) repeat protein